MLLICDCTFFPVYFAKDGKRYKNVLYTELVFYEVMYSGENIY